VKAVFTNTAAVDAYRGAGRPRATYSSSDVEQAAREMKMTRRDPPPQLHHQFPYATPVGLTTTSATTGAHLGQGMQMADVRGFPAAKRSRARARSAASATAVHRGLRPRTLEHRRRPRRPAVSSRPERCGCTRPGTVTVFTGSHSHGQGHETTFAQVVAGRLGIPIENVEIVHGDTGRVPFGMGTYGSRSLSVGGTAIIKASTRWSPRRRRSPRT
jgi:carbon-monoxide dehydrogenase large subunit